MILPLGCATLPIGQGALLDHVCLALPVTFFLIAIPFFTPPPRCVLESDFFSQVVPTFWLPPWRFIVPLFYRVTFFFFAIFFGEPIRFSFSELIVLGHEPDELQPPFARVLCAWPASFSAIRSIRKVCPPPRIACSQLFSRVVHSFGPSQMLASHFPTTVLVDCLCG